MNSYPVPVTGSMILFSDPEAREKFANNSARPMDRFRPVLDLPAGLAISICRAERKGSAHGLRAVHGIFCGKVGQRLELGTS
jgi:hypothetical protein